MSEPVIEYQPRSASLLARKPHVFLLLAITILGGVLRFWKISEPALWGDEAATYARTCGTYQDLIDRLQFDGFVPLHYEMYEWIHAGLPMWGHIKYDVAKPVQPRGRGFFASFATTRPTSQPAMKRFLVGEHPIFPNGVRMTPLMMRLVPALAGTLMIPAMYFLAMQIVNRRAALIAAIFSAGSAYLLVYSRDAKMYSHLWLFCTLSAGCFLWWLRVRTRLAWLCWVAASVAMCGIHAPGAVLLGIELLIFLSYDRQWWMPGCILLTGFVVSGLFHGQTRFFSAHVDDRWLVLGLAFIVGIAVYVWRRKGDWKPSVYFVLGLAVILTGIGGYYLKFNRFVEQIDERNWSASMLQWVDLYNKGRDVSNFVTFPATAYLMSWEWAQPGEENFIDPRALRLLHGAVYVSGAMVVLGLFPWRKLRRKDELDAIESPGDRNASGIRVLWLVGWIVIPAYAFYCVSMGAESKLDKGVFTPGFVSPNVWFAALRDWIHTMRIWALAIGCLIALGAYFAGRTWRERAFKAGGVVAALIVIYALCGGSYLLIKDLNKVSLANNTHWHSLWMPRYLGMVWPAFAIVLATMLSRLPTKGIRYGAVTFVLLANLSQFGARLHQGEPPTEFLARDMLAAAPDRTYMLGSFRYGWGARPGEGLVQSPAWRYYIAEMTDLKLTPQEFRSDAAPFNRVTKALETNNTNWIANDVKRSGQITQIVVWDKVDRGTRDWNRDDALPMQLGATWRKGGEETFDAFDHWTWQNLYELRRRVYVRVGR